MIADCSGAEREYYRRFFGFDPISDRRSVEGKDSDRMNEIIVPDISYFYESTFPLSQDASLTAEGVVICARVVVDANGVGHNRIVFQGTHEEAAVHCVHTVLFGDSRTPLQVLPPWGHFAALKSYVAALAETGIGHLLEASFAPVPATEEPLPFGFNPTMQREVLQAISLVAPGAADALLRDWGMSLLDSVPIEWLKARKEILALGADLQRLLYLLWDAAPPEWLVANQEKMFELFGTGLMALFREPTAGEQNYFRQVWHLDIFGDRIPLPSGYRYEREVLLPLDSELRRHGVTLRGRVDFIQLSPRFFLDPPVWVPVGGGERHWEQLFCSIFLCRGNQKYELHCHRPDFELIDSIIRVGNREISDILPPPPPSQWRACATLPDTPWEYFAALFVMLEGMVENSVIDAILAARGRLEPHKDWLDGLVLDFFGNFYFLLTQLAPELIQKSEIREKPGRNLFWFTPFDYPPPDPQLKLRIDHRPDLSKVPITPNYLSLAIVDTITFLGIVDAYGDDHGVTAELIGGRDPIIRDTYRFEMGWQRDGREAEIEERNGSYYPRAIDPRIRLKRVPISSFWAKYHASAWRVLPPGNRLKKRAGRPSTRLPPAPPPLAPRKQDSGKTHGISIRVEGEDE